MAKKSGKGLKVLIPLLSKTENDAEFLERAVKGANEVTLLLVIDNSADGTQFGFALQQMAAGNALSAEVKAMVGKKKKSVHDILEWGNTRSKIVNTAKLRRVSKVVLRAQEGKGFEALVEALRAEKINVEVI